MTDLVFFYGTLMSGFQRPGRARLDHVLEQVGRGWIRAALFDLGIYPAAVPAADGRDLPQGSGWDVNKSISFQGGSSPSLGLE